MSLLKITAKWMTILAFIGLLAALIWPWSYPVRELISSGNYRPYLEQHVQTVDLSRGDDAFQFPTNFYGNRLYLLGENHGTAVAHDVDLALIKHLYKTVGVRWLMAELTFVQAERFNAYLDSGDESYATPVFEAWVNAATQWGNQQHFDKLRQLRAFNLSVPADQRLRFFGVDLIRENERADALTWLGLMLDGHANETPEALRALLNTVDPLDNDALSLKVDNALEALNSGEQVNESLDIRAIVHLLQNLRYSLEGQRRYQAITANIEAMVTTFGIGDDEPLYGFWGLFHVMKAVVNDVGNPLARQLMNSDLPFAGGIVSMVMVYADSQHNMPSHVLPGFLQDDGPYTAFTNSQNNVYLNYLYGIGDLIAVAGNANVAIFSLYEEGSPFRGDTRLRTQSGLLTSVFKFEFTPPTQQPAEYLVLINGSAAVDQWQP